VVVTKLFGCSVLFCSDMSQGIANVVVQSTPFGQHSTVVLDARGMHTEDGGQQKLGESLEGTGCNRSLDMSAFV